MKNCPLLSQVHTYRQFPYSPNGRVTVRYLQERCDRYQSKRPYHSPEKTVARIYGLTPMNSWQWREAYDHTLRDCGLEETHSKKNGQVMALSVDHDQVSGTVEGVCVIDVTCW